MSQEVRETATEPSSRVAKALKRLETATHDAVMAERRHSAMAATTVTFAEADVRGRVWEQVKGETLAAAEAWTVARDALHVALIDAGVL